MTSHAIPFSQHHPHRNKREKRTKPETRAQELDRLRRENAELIAKLTPLVTIPPWQVSASDLQSARDFLRRLTAGEDA